MARYDTNTATASSVTDDGPWRYWTTSVTASVTDSVWATWTNTTLGTGANYAPPAPAPAAPALDKKALKRARALVYMLLDYKERRRYRKHGYARVTGGDGAEYLVCKPSHHGGMAYKLAGASIQKVGLCQTAAGFCEDDRVAAVILALRCDTEETARKWHDIHMGAEESERVARIAA